MQVFLQGKIFLVNLNGKLVPTYRDDFDRKYPRSPVVTNDCLAFSPERDVLDVRILHWLENCYYKPEKISLVDPGKSLQLMLAEQQYVRDHQALIPQAMQYTKFMQQINANHHFEVNQNAFLKLQEKETVEQNLAGKSEYYQGEAPGLDRIQTGIVYDFFNPVGKVIGKGFSVTKLDRKQNIDLFKTQNCPYYLIDFRQFEPNMISFYLPDFIHPNFYDEHTHQFGDDFKNRFLAWINGSSKDDHDFSLAFPKVVQLRNRLTSNVFINYFGHTIRVDQEYKRLGYLIQSTAGDLIKHLHAKIYALKEKRFTLIWSLFDEFFIRGEYSQFLDTVHEAWPFLELKVSEM